VEKKPGKISMYGVTSENRNITIPPVLSVPERGMQGEIIEREFLKGIFLPGAARHVTRRY
jgi:hypothetical protein